MANRVYANNVSTKLTAQLLAAGTSVSVEDGSGFAGAATGSNWIIATLRRMSGYADVAREIVKVTNRSSNTLTVVRAQEGTVALQFEIGDRIDIDLTAASMTEGRPGTTTNDDAAAGMIGEVISSIVVNGSSVSLTTNTAADMTSIALTAGDWDVWFEAAFSIAATTTVSLLLANISLASATLQLTAGKFAAVMYPGSAPGALDITANAGPHRVSIAAPTTIYAVGYATFGVSTLKIWGILRARRVR